MIPDCKILAAAIAEIKGGGVVAYPTESVWGLGCDPFNQSAVAKVLALKARPPHKGMILVASNIEQLGELLAPLNVEQCARLRSSWPGAITWVIEDINNLYPGWVKGQHSSIAVRVSSHPVVKALCNGFGGVLVSTSANLSGLSPATTEQQSRAYFGGGVGCYLSGEVGGNQQPSRIYSLSTSKLLR